MNGYKTFAVIVYVTDTEQQAVMRMFDWQDLKIDGDDQEYKEAFIEKDGKKQRIISAKQDEMGMVASTALSAKMIAQFVPEYIIMPGIAAGVGVYHDSNEQEYGDVMLADSVWNYSNGKYVSPGKGDITFGELGFEPRPSLVRITGDHIKTIIDYAGSGDHEYHVHCGPLASGAAVVANQAFLVKRIVSNSGETKGVEMEAYGVAYAANHCDEPRPYAIIAKSICDFGNEEKNDSFQKFAAYTSCGFVKELIENVLECTCEGCGE